MSNTRRRAQRALDAARTGPTTAAVAPNTVTTWPAVATDTPSELPSSGNSPASTSSQVPTAKAPTPNTCDARIGYCMVFLRRPDAARPADGPRSRHSLTAASEYISGSRTDPSG